MSKPGSFYSGCDECGEYWKDVMGREHELRVVNWGHSARPVHRFLSGSLI